MDRRAFMRHALWIAAAPAIVRASSLMAVSALAEETIWLIVSPNAPLSQAELDAIVRRSARDRGVRRVFGVNAWCGTCSTVRHA